jgi:alkylation response protein AidB-like acyl-CoA dehydrogenase
VPLTYDDQQQDFINVVTDALARNCPVSLTREVGSGHPERWREVWGHVTAIGLTGMLIPESAGGLGLGAADMAAVLEAAGHFALPAPLLTTLGCFVPLVVEAGRDGGADPILNRISDGSAGTVAVTLGADGRTPEAVLDGRLLTVQADGVPEPERSEWIAIPARRADDGRVVLVVADPVELGIVARPAMDPSSPVGALELTEQDIGIGATVLEGDPRPALPLLWIAASSDLIGVAAELVARSAAYARDRVQFGRPIGSFQGVKHLIVDAHIAVERARSLTQYAALLVDEGNLGMLPAAHNAKASASEAASSAARVAIQVHGGSGITVEEDVSLLYLRARQQSQLFGDADFHYGLAGA